MERDAWFFVGILVFIFLIWIATGGPTHPISFTGPTLAQPEELGGGTYLQFPRAPFTIGSPETRLLGSSNGAERPAAAPRYDSSFGPTSAYRNIVSLNDYISNADTVKEYVEINVSQNAGGPVNITGWTLASETTGNTEVIPRGTAVPILGVVNQTQNILLNPGDRAIVSSGQSPMGVSFRENKCTGYLNTFQNFYPALPQNCPTAAKELETFYGSRGSHDLACVDYMETVPRCRFPLGGKNDLSVTCKAFLTDYLNYNGCVNVHQGDADSAGNTWRIYLGRKTTSGKTKPMWRTSREVVQLFDERYKTVDEFSD